LSIAEIGKLDGLRFTLDRKRDRKDPCCKNEGVIHAVAGVPEIWCAHCGMGRGELYPQAVEWMLNVLAFWPDAANETHTLRDHNPNLSPLSVRRANGRNRKHEPNTETEGTEDE
jgi:hypothetical protein